MLPIALFAQVREPMGPVESTADTAYAEHQWVKAEVGYSALASQEPDNAHFWFRLGVSARSNEHFDLALKALGKAKALGAEKGLPGYVADYELATTFAARGDAVRALESLKASADAGFAQIARLENDLEWNTLRGEQTFRKLLKQVQHNAAPCEDSTFRQFDFWLGDWDVASSVGGPQQGTSHISKEIGGCVIWENWTSASSRYFGKSYNTYNVNLQRWEQYWVDNSAGVIFYYGDLKDGVMDYWTDDVPQTNGGKLRRHLQFFSLSPEKVRQLSQGSTDGGKTWNVEYDFIYTRHKSTPESR
jgi:tetratricopeptide (TPR) repeat protein